MKFLIQTYDGKITHDFSFTLLESLRYQNWYTKSDEFQTIFTDDGRPKRMDGVIPCGSVEFVSNYLTDYHRPPMPINVPEELMAFHFSHRHIINGSKKDIKESKFVKSRTKFKSFAEIVANKDLVPDGDDYQISDLIDIDSEWRSFVYQNKLVGLQNYSGEFTMFPNVTQINNMIKAFEPSAPIAYTLDVGINECGTFVIEVHDFFSCGLYGFADHRVLPFMFSRWFYEFTK